MMIVASLLPSFKMYADPIDVPIILGYIDLQMVIMGDTNNPYVVPNLQSTVTPYISIMGATIQL